MPPRMAAAGHVFWLSRADKPRIAKSEVPRKLEKASRSKGVNEHGRRRQGGGPARGSRGRGGGGRRGVCSVETTAAPAGPAAVIECANDNWCGNVAVSHIWLLWQLAITGYEETRW